MCFFKTLSNRLSNSLDSLFNDHKEEGLELFRTITFGSPFYVLKFFFDLEKQIRTLRYLLKAKYMKLSDEELTSLMGGSN